VRVSGSGSDHRGRLAKRRPLTLSAFHVPPKNSLTLTPSHTLPAPRGPRGSG